MCYGVFGFRPAGGTSGTAGAGATLDADGLNLGGHDGLTRVGSSARLKVATSLAVMASREDGKITNAEISAICEAAGQDPLPVTRRLKLAEFIRTDLKSSGSRPTTRL